MLIDKRVPNDVDSISSDGESFNGYDDQLINLEVDLNNQDEVKRRNSLSYKINSLLWDSVDKTPLERSFLFKLDFFLLSTSMLGYFIKNLNASNVGTAYVNGMKEYYMMNGNQYNYICTVWTIGYMLGQIPSSFILHNMSPRFYLAGMEFIWGSLTLLLVYQKSLNGFCIVRFFIGFAESGYFCSIETLFGSWYDKKEITKRSTLFACSGSAAGMISGVLQQFILESSWAHQKFEPFQWMFIIDAMISFPISLYTLLFNPNTPLTTTSFYFTDNDKRVALERRRRTGAQMISSTKENYTWTKIKRYGKTWHIWVFPILFLTFNNSCTPLGEQTFQLWMKNSLGLEPHQYNIYPIAISASGIIYSIMVAYINDYSHGKLNPFFLSIMFISVGISCGSLAIWDIPNWLHWLAYFGIGIPLKSGQPLIFSWLNRSLAHDDLKRSFVIVFTNTFAYVTGSWVPILTFNHNSQPEFHVGFIYTTILAITGLIFTFLTLYFVNKDEKRLKLSTRDNESLVSEESPLLG